MAQTLNWESFIEKLLEDCETENSWSNLYDDLCSIHENPININTVSTEELSQLPFLTFQQIEEIQAYIYNYGPMKSLGELNLIKGLDYNTRQILHFFLYCGENQKNQNLPSLKKMLNYGKSEFVVRTDIPFYELSDSYEGSNLYHSIRYKFKYSDRVEAGLVGEKDMGESTFPDSYSYYFSLGNMGKLKKLIVGSYRLSFAQGLVINTNFTLGKTSVLLQSGSQGKGIRPHYSTSEYNYFRGVAATVQVLPQVELSAFYSFKNVDATLSNGEISSLKDDGYHRTTLEKSKKGNVQNQLAGGHLEISLGKFHAGVTSAYTYYNLPFKENTSGYRLYYPKGNQFWNNSVNYDYRSYRFIFIGECAMSAQGGWASLHRATFRLFTDTELTFLHRYYSPKYNSIYSSAFGEGSSVKNEHGFYTGLNIPFSRSLIFTGYVDYFKFPYLRYGVTHQNTQGIDISGEIQYKKSNNFSASLRYRNKNKQGDYTDENGKKGLAYTMTQKWKLQTNYTLTKLIQGKTIINVSQVREGYHSSSTGYSVTQSLHVRIKAIQFTLNGIYFHTDDYDSRVFCYEQGLLYSFSIPSYYGEGYRVSGIFRYECTKNFMIQTKMGYTHKQDYNRPLLNILLRYKF